MDNTKAIIHPVRLRIIQAAYDGEIFTTQQMTERILDVSRPSIYRQIAILKSAGILEVVALRKIRGVTERQFRLKHSKVVISDSDAVKMTNQEHKDAFESALISLIGEFNQYITKKDVKPYRDGVSYRQSPLWLNHTERTELLDDISGILRKYGSKLPGNNRQQFLLSTIFFPDDHVGLDGDGSERLNQSS